MSDGGIIGAIPARYASTRLPGKPLLSIAGRPMIEHVYRRVSDVAELDRAVVLTDDERIAAAVEAFGGEVQMTPADCASGTDRIAWAARSWNDCRAVVNIQGDEPLIEPESVARLAAHLASTDDGMVTLAAPLAADQAGDPNMVKVVLDQRGYALYFSRSEIPYPRNAGVVSPWLHVGIYGYRRDVLLRLATLDPTPLEQAESLEQLRALENGISLRVLTLDRPAAAGVDTAQDLARIEAAMRSSASSESERSHEH